MIKRMACGYRYMANFRLRILVTNYKGTRAASHFLMYKWSIRNLDFYSILNYTIGRNPDAQKVPKKHCVIHRIRDVQG